MANKQREIEKSEDLSKLMFGRVMPQALELEEVVLGACMLDKEAFSIIVEKLKPETFYLQAHQEIFQVMLDLFASMKPIDILTVHEELKKRGKLDNICLLYTSPSPRDRG